MPDLDAAARDKAGEGRSACRRQLGPGRHGRDSPVRSLISLTQLRSEFHKTRATTGVAGVKHSSREHGTELRDNPNEL